MHIILKFCVDFTTMAPFSRELMSKLFIIIYLFRDLTTSRYYTLRLTAYILYMNLYRVPI